MTVHQQRTIIANTIRFITNIWRFVYYSNLKILQNKHTSRSDCTLQICIYTVYYTTTFVENSIDTKLPNYSLLEFYSDSVAMNVDKLFVFYICMYQIFKWFLLKITHCFCVCEAYRSKMDIFLFAISKHLLQIRMWSILFYFSPIIFCYSKKFL